MTSHEAQAILARLSAAFPGNKLEAPTVRVWLDNLRGITPEDGLEAARRCEHEDRWFPTIARFREFAYAERRAREHAEARTRGLPEAEPDFARNLEKLRELRASLASLDRFAKEPS